jgi:hypothetical protein
MAGFLFRLERTDGLPADPPPLSAAVPNCSPGDVIPLAAAARCASWLCATRTQISRPSWS